jgi:hypothetical protein
MIPRYSLLLVSLALLAGCVTVDVTVKDDGSADLIVSYPALDKVTEEQVKPMLTAPGVTIKSVSVTPRAAAKDAATDTPAAGAQDGKATPAKAWVNTVTATLSVTDVEKIETIPFMTLFGLDVVSTTGDDGQKTLKATLKNPSPGKGPPTPSDNVITIHVPGELGETTGIAEAGAAVWKFKTTEYFATAETAFSLTYKAAAKADAGAKDAAANPS